MNLSSPPTASSLSDEIFFSSFWCKEEVAHYLAALLRPADDGEIFLEYKENEVLSMEDGVLRHASFDNSRGFGLRAVCGEQTFYAHSHDLSLKSLKQAGEGLNLLDKSRSCIVEPLKRTIRHDNLYDKSRYSLAHPHADYDFLKRVSFLSEIEDFISALDPHIVHISTSLQTEWQVVQIMRPEFLQIGLEGEMADIRPLIRLDIRITLEKNGKRERGYSGKGGRFGLDVLFNPEIWQNMAREALRLAYVNLEAAPAPAGEMPLILGAGWPGILLHEAVGHGLEGDFNRKKTSVFSDKIGKKIASSGVNIIDDATFFEQRGSLNIDDEGIPAGKTLQIENGILQNYIHDRLNARLMGHKPTGNGRRQSYAHAPMPRMTNTVMLPGDCSLEEMLSTVKNGLYAVNFGGGQVDITSGKFVFAASEAYLIESGKITTAVKGATLIGSGAEVMQKIDMIGQKMALDPGIGTCGKAGQHVPVGVGQPMLKLSGVTIGGIAS